MVFVGKQGQTPVGSFTLNLQASAHTKKRKKKKKQEKDLVKKCSWAEGNSSNSDLHALSQSCPHLPKLVDRHLNTNEKFGQKPYCS